MLRKITYKGVSLPRLYLAEDEADIQLAKNNGLPYIASTLTMDKVVRLILMPYASEVFGVSMRDLSLMDKIVHVPSERIAHRIDGTQELIEPEADCLHDDYNLAGDDGAPAEARSYYVDWDLIDLAERSNYEVDPRVLEELDLLPAFVGDIATCIRRNLTNTKWTEGYNKKRKAAIGKMKAQTQLPNLILIDVSGSIPSGISIMMLGLANTLRHQCNAELVIHSDNAQWFDMSEELPDPEKLRSMFGYCNESTKFAKVMTKHVYGREFSHIIAFGDFDSFHVDYVDEINDDRLMAKTKCHHLHNYFVFKDKDSSYCQAVRRGKNMRCGFVNWLEQVDEETTCADWYKKGR